MGQMMRPSHGPHVEGSTQLLGQPRGSISESQAPQEKLNAQPIEWIILDFLVRMSRFNKHVEEQIQCGDGYVQGQLGSWGQVEEGLIQRFGRSDGETAFKDGECREFNHQLEEDVLMKVGFETMVEELQGQFQGTLNSMLDTIKLDVQTKLDHYMAEELRDKVKDVKGDWALCKEAVLKKTQTPKEPNVLNSFKPKSFNGIREAKELNKFSRWMMMSPTLFLTDNALMWWRHRSMEIDKDTFTFETWDAFKKDIMLHFYPENAKYEAKEKLRWLKQTGSVKDYVTTFTNLLFEVPSMTDEDKLMYFMSGL
ncbi:hypothetical protein L3X38_018504 [Prunus dulcis]|uniref:Retrotransposon gag domain-containing protein n=1 Tax=Prunus dulcis TaxID=3755 RepID=A0AAD4ZA57_PRUDU|nr:hypothetical protein L3X38_018504 [Prunus dulcis]